ncbi:MAG: SsrA-binding protein, partial [Candidatus Thermoplasmatota archaeon]|nr:SsrA-binding protein [Candidatus Thermoplasmatota archaeon]
MKAVKNKKAYHDYKIIETLEVGIVLTGNEVKSIKGGTISLAGSYVQIRKG